LNLERYKYPIPYPKLGITKERRILSSKKLKSDKVIDSISIYQWELNPRMKKKKVNAPLLDPKNEIFPVPPLQKRNTRSNKRLKKKGHKTVRYFLKVNALKQLEVRIKIKARDNSIYRYRLSEPLNKKSSIPMVAAKQ